jgi:hypothetical protein
MSYPPKTPKIWLFNVFEPYKALKILVIDDMPPFAANF